MSARRVAALLAAGLALVAFAMWIASQRRLERATLADPDKSNPFYLLYRSYLTLKQPEKAASALQKFKQLKAKGL